MSRIGSRSVVRRAVTRDQCQLHSCALTSGTATRWVRSVRDFVVLRVDGEGTPSAILALARGSRSLRRGVTMARTETSMRSRQTSGCLQPIPSKRRRLGTSFSPSALVDVYSDCDSSFECVTARIRFSALRVVRPTACASDSVPGTSGLCSLVDPRLRLRIASNVRRDGFRGSGRHGPSTPGEWCEERTGYRARRA